MNDIINGCFESFSGFMLWLSVYKLYKDKKIRGVSIVSTGFFSLWGYWNLYYYPSLHQWFSFFGGLNIVVANSTWLGQMIYYRKN